MLLAIVLAFCGGLAFAAPPELDERHEMPAAMQKNVNLSARDIIEAAYSFAGGDEFRRPGSLFLSGYNIIRSQDGQEILWDKYAMWREFSEDKPDAHKASGKVRIEAWRNDKLALFLTYDGENTYNASGKMPSNSANAMWSNNFGFGAIRHALDEGWVQNRLADDLIDGEPAFFVLLTDPSGGKTLFGFRQSDFAILSVGFDTAKGWHERRYSHFFRKPGQNWLQAGRVRLFYNGIKANEAIWTDYRIGASWPNALFSPPAPPQSPSW